VPRPGASVRPRADAGVEKYLGLVVDGRYQVERVLGDGGMGTVYLCRRTVIDKLVAMKVLHSELMNDPEVVERFVTEAKAASSIGSAHIVDVFDFGTMPDGCTYFVMEYLEGRSLTEVVVRDAPLPPRRVQHIARQLAEGLGAAHTQGIVHRDLKPDNVFLIKHLKEEEFVKILDFGIAKMAKAQNRVTRAGSVFGTPQYMSPEQARGIELDHRTDLYALGIILYELLTGRVPFDADEPMGILSQHVNTPVVPIHRLPKPPPEVSPGLEAMVLKCLAKDPAERYANTQAFLDDLERVEGGVPPVALTEPVQRDGLNTLRQNAALEPPGAARAALSSIDVELDLDPTPAVPPVFWDGSETGERARAVGARLPDSEPRVIVEGAAPPSSSPRSSLADRARLAPDAQLSLSDLAFRPKRRWHLVAAVASVGVALGAYALSDVALFGAAAPALPSAVPAAPAAPSASVAPRGARDVGDVVPVSVLVFPFRAQVFRGSENLGQPPVTVLVPRGGRVKLEARLEGHWTRRFEIDSSKPKVALRLAPITRDQRAALSRQARPASSAAVVAEPPAEPTAPPNVPEPPPVATTELPPEYEDAGPDPDAHAPEPP
jgi:serine/threonine protein kinase